LGVTGMEVFARDMEEGSFRSDSFRLTLMTTANFSGVPVLKEARVFEERAAYGGRKGDLVRRDLRRG